MNQVEFEKYGLPAGFIMNYQPGDPECMHPLPNDWEFGGATGQDPRADPRWTPVTYAFLDRMLHNRWVTQEPFCDHAAKGHHLQRVRDMGHPIFYITSTMDTSHTLIGGIVFADPDGAFNAA